MLTPAPSATLPSRAAALSPTTMPTTGATTPCSTVPVSVTEGGGKRPHLCEVSEFATIDQLSKFLPKVKDRDAARRCGISFSKRSNILLAQSMLIISVLTCNITLTVIATTKYQSDGAVGVIYDGDCTTVGRLNLWLHFLINILSMAMLSASNYCIQLYCAPTREILDIAHARKPQEWLDVGFASLRNLRFIKGWPRAATVALAISSLPIQMLYNSSLFESLSSFEYTVVLVESSFSQSNTTWTVEQPSDTTLPNGDWAWTGQDQINPPEWNYTKIIADMQRQAKANESTSPYWIYSNISTCFATYNDYFAPQGNVFIYVKNQSGQSPPTNSVIQYVSVLPRWDSWPKNLWALSNDSTTGELGKVRSDLTALSGVTTWYLLEAHYEVDHCLMQKPPANFTGPHCQLQFSPWILWIVCFFNLVKALIVSGTWVASLSRTKAGSSSEPLYTLGDVVASFMKEPPKETEKPTSMPKTTTTNVRSKKATWPSKKAMWPKWMSSILPDKTLNFLGASKGSGKQWPKWMSSILPDNAFNFLGASKGSGKQWRHTVSLRIWMLFLGMFFGLYGSFTVLLFLCFVSLRRRNIAITIPFFWSMGLGSLQEYTFLTVGLPRQDPNGLVANILVANLPQLLLSGLYIVYNFLLTNFLVQYEFSRMANEKGRKPLRVSKPVGIQRSTYTLSLPLRYGLPHYIASGLLNWLISQSFFLARVTALHPDGSTDVDHSFSTCAFSPIAIFIALLVGAVLVLAVVILGFRKYEGDAPIVATNSLAISAVCQTMDADRKEGHLLPVRWAMVRVDNEGIGHYGFTTAPDSEIRRVAAYHTSQNPLLASGMPKS